MRRKIRGGTVNHGAPSLCHTCRLATIIRGQRLRDEIVECGRLSDRSGITFSVTCGIGYSDRRYASIREVEEIAWVLGSDLRRGEIGFMHAQKLKPGDRYVLADEWD